MLSRPQEESSHMTRVLVLFERASSGPTIAVSRSVSSSSPERAEGLRRTRSAAWLFTVLGVCVLAGCQPKKRYVEAAFDPVLLTTDQGGDAAWSDSSLVNPIGLELSPGANFWLANNGTGTLTVHAPDGTPLPSAAPIAVHLPVPPGAPAGAHAAPTGIAYYGGSGLEIQSGSAKDTARYLVATLDGTILGYNSGVDQNNMLLALDNSASGAAYWGIAAAALANGTAWVYVTNFKSGTVDVFNEKFEPATGLDPAAFEDQELPPNYAPFGIYRFGDTLFVSYAERAADGRTPVAGDGKGYINLFALNGQFEGHFAAQGDLNAPWGMTLSPWSFEYFGTALLVGNTGDGHINAFSPVDGSPLGALYTSAREPLAIDGLWGLDFGWGLDGYPALFFTAGSGGGAHGGFGTVFETAIDPE
jgi:uncharacterized protein (TIGR03118 family)